MDSNQTQTIDNSIDSSSIVKKQIFFTKDFTMVVIGQIISLFGNSILRFALPLYLLKETGSPALFGFVSACSFLPMIIMSVMGGILADRVNKRNIMVILDFSTAALITILFILLGKAPIVPLFTCVMMILYGIQGTYQPAVQASLPLLVSSDNMIKGNATINLVSSLAGLIGPVTGGMLFSAWGLNPILIISIICFIISAVMEIFINIPYTKRDNSLGMFKIIANDFKESYTYLKTKQPLWISLMAVVATLNLFMSSMMIIGLPVIIVQKLGMSDTMFGFAEAALAIGGLTGGIIASIFGKKLNIKKGYKFLFACTLCILPMGIVFFLPISPFVTYIIITILSFCVMIFSTMFTILVLSFVQVEAPKELVGKIISLAMAIAMIAQPIGQSLYGVLFEKFSNIPGAVILLASIAAVFISFFSKTIFDKLKLVQK